MAAREASDGVSVGLTGASRLLGDGGEDTEDFNFFASSGSEKDHTATESAVPSTGFAESFPEKIEGGGPSSGSVWSGNDKAAIESDSARQNGHPQHQQNMEAAGVPRNHISHSHGRSKRNPGGGGSPNRRPPHPKDNQMDMDEDRPPQPTDLGDDALVQALRNSRDRNVALTVEATLYDYIFRAQMQFGPETFNAEPYLYPWLPNPFHRLVVYRVCDRFLLHYVQVKDEQGNQMVKISILKKSYTPRYLLYHFVGMFPDYFAIEDPKIMLKSSAPPLPAGANVNAEARGPETESSPEKQPTVSPVAVPEAEPTSRPRGPEGVNRIMQRPKEAKEGGDTADTAASADGSVDKSEEQIDEERMQAYEKKKLAIFGEDGPSEDPESDEVTGEGVASSGTSSDDNNSSRIGGSGEGRSPTDGSGVGVGGWNKSIRTSTDQAQSDPDFQARRAKGWHDGRTQWTGSDEGGSRGGGRGGGGRYRSGGRGRGRGRGWGRDMMGADGGMGMAGVMYPGYDMQQVYGGAAEMMMSAAYMHGNADPQVHASYQQMMAQQYGGISPYGMMHPPQMQEQMAGQSPMQAAMMSGQLPMAGMQGGLIMPPPPQAPPAMGQSNPPTATEGIFLPPRGM